MDIFTAKQIQKNIKTNKKTSIHTQILSKKHWKDRETMTHHPPNIDLAYVVVSRDLYARMIVMRFNDDKLS